VQDVAMSVKTLRYVNSAAFGLAHGVDSIRHAAVLVGRDTLRSWTVLELMSSFADTPIELARLALVRARFCELVARRCGLADPDAFYTVGMLSLLDAMTNSSMDAVAERLPVTHEMRRALLGHDSRYRAALVLARSIEQGTSGSRCVTSDPALAADHRTASAWATELFGAATTRSY